MNPMLFRSGFMVSLFTTILFFGCTSTPEKTRVTVSDYQGPEWVNKGSGAFKDGSGEKVFYGVGIASDIRSASLRRSAADDRALAAIAVQMKTTITRMAEDYGEAIGRSTTKGNESTEKEGYEVGFRALVKKTLPGAKIIDHWEHPSKNELYSLARIELKAMEAMEKKIDSHKELSDESRDAIKKKAQKLFEEMEKKGL